MLAVGTDLDLTISQRKPRVVFVVTVRNNAALLDACLASVAAQTYPWRRCVIVDDASGDGTLDVARRWAYERPDLFAACGVPTRRGKLANFVDAVADVDDHDVVVELDGDDSLLAADAATDLARLHMRADLIWTQHRVARHQWPSWIHWRSTDVPHAYRDRCDMPRLAWTRSWYPGHLRTCKAWAFRRIDLADLKAGGAWVTAAADMAYYAPLVEMTSPALRYFYDRELALYNITAQNDHFREDTATTLEDNQGRMAAELASRPPYKTCPAPLWLGKLDAHRHEAITRAWWEQSAKDPATRFILAAVGSAPDSWHPRVQIVARPDVLRASRHGANSDQAVLEWLSSLVDVPLADGRRPIPDLPLVEVSA